MMHLSQYEGKIVRVIDADGRTFTGVAVSFPADYGFHEFNRLVTTDSAGVKKAAEGKGHPRV